MNPINTTAPKSKGTLFPCRKIYTISIKTLKNKTAVGMGGK